MRISTAGNILVALGALVGVVAVVVIVADYAPALTPEMIRLLFFKGLGAAAVGLIVVGSIVGRFGRERQRRVEAESRLEQRLVNSALDVSPVVSDSSYSQPDPSPVASVRERPGAAESDR